MGRHRKLTEDEIKEVRAKYMTGTVSQAELARYYDVARASIKYALDGCGYVYGVGGRLITNTGRRS
jgi:hypothetical protein